MIRKLLALGIILITCSVVEAQERLHTYNVLEAFSLDTRESLESRISHNSESVFISSHTTEAFAVQKGFSALVYIDEFGGIQQSRSIDKKLGKSIAELFYLLVATSSPQYISSARTTHECLFVSRIAGSIAECQAPEKTPLTKELWDVCSQILDFASFRSWSLPDDVYLKVSRLIAEYKKLLNIEVVGYKADGESDFTRFEIGSRMSYLNITLNCADAISLSYERAKAVMNAVASYLLANSDGPVCCNIIICDEEGGIEGHSGGLDDIRVSKEDFNEARMLERCRGILCRRENREEIVTQYGDLLEYFSQ